MYPKEIEKFLLGVQKPGRYTGGELNSIISATARPKRSWQSRFRSTPTTA